MEFTYNGSLHTSIDEDIEGTFSRVAEEVCCGVSDGAGANGERGARDEVAGDGGHARGIGKDGFGPGGNGRAGSYCGSDSLGCGAVGGDWAKVVSSTCKVRVNSELIMHELGVPRGSCGQILSSHIVTLVLVVQQVWSHRLQVYPVLVDL